jgi:hypothetical protein
MSDIPHPLKMVGDNKMYIFNLEEPPDKGGEDE